jgi:hypothetical protein
MSVLELHILGANASVKRYPCVRESVEVSQLRRQARRARLLVEEEHLIQHSQQREAEHEAHNGDKHPVSCEPEDDLDVGPVPAVAEVVREEAPGVVVVFLRKEDADAVVTLGGQVVVVPPDDAEEERARGGHDGDVGEGPSAVVVGERVDGLEEEGVAGDGAHGVVGDARGGCAADPRGVGEERVEAAVASLWIVSCAVV